jgi:hypothetical protein
MATLEHGLCPTAQSLVGFKPQPCFRRVEVGGCAQNHFIISAVCREEVPSVIQRAGLTCPKCDNTLILDFEPLEL